MRIKQAQSSEEMDEARRLFREYQENLGVDLCFQGFEEELAGLPGKYAPPNGALLIGLTGDQTVGCVAIRKLEVGVCEMKRLYVKPESRGSGFGRQLVQESIAIAYQLGYSLMRLDTLDGLTEAMRLYETFGFVQTAPYYENPLPGVVYWKLDLNKEQTGRRSEGDAIAKSARSAASDASEK